MSQQITGTVGVSITVKLVIVFFFDRIVLITLLAFTVRSVWIVSMVMPLMELLETARSAHVKVRERQREYLLPECLNLLM